MWKGPASTKGTEERMGTSNRRMGSPLAQPMVNTQRLLMIVLIILLCIIIYSATENSTSWGVFYWINSKDRATGSKLSKVQGACGDPQVDLSHVHLDNFCGNWQNDYTARHQLQRQQLTGVIEKGLQDGVTGTPLPDWRKKIPEDAFPNILIFVCDRESDGLDCGGMGDTLLGATSAFLYAILSKRALFLSWPKYESSFLPGEINWKLPKGFVLPQFVADLTEGRDASGDATVERHGRDVVLIDYFGRGSIPSIEDLDVQTAGAKIVVVRQNKGYVVPWLLADAGLQSTLGVQVSQAWGCLNRFLLWANPMPTALDFVALGDQIESQDALSICVHVRLGDEEIHANQSLYKDSEHESLVDAIMESVEILEKYWQTEACSSTNVFFFSSSNHLKEIAAARYKNVITTPVRPVHTGLLGVSRLSDVQMTAREWSLLSKCKMYLLTQSGFSATAVARGLHMDKIFTISLSEKLVPWRPAHILDLATSWSGL
ncbi:fucosyltransferase [Klebsormidium nitens]|uniref:Fucosyltransferase n=1 Tax=Klebsormidium nitens TaxID=105231 RepID=A0A1Y1HTE3_KLENI|nr:fucosyltransferase [Klebsormidium nitens]|eukprot:GAQ81890.1 fucosyltransferase [Klebsormidium nitens]